MERWAMMGADAFRAAPMKSPWASCSPLGEVSRTPWGTVGSVRSVKYDLGGGQGGRLLVGAMGNAYLERPPLGGVIRAYLMK